MNKKLLKFFRDFFGKPLVQVGFYIVGIFLIFLISGVFDDYQKSLEKIMEIVSAQETISVFFAGILSLGLAKVLKKCDYYLEESLKIADDHHKIISQYSGHAKKEIAGDGNFCDKTGVFMYIRHTKPLKKEIKNKENDPYSKAYKENAKGIAQYMEGTLYLPSLNMYTNFSGNTALSFKDAAEAHKLPSFVLEHADELLNAHRNSAKKNNNTIRLDDFTYEDNKLILNTKRSTYYHMLITNRCMDYSFANGLSIRDLYEYDTCICPLHKSKFGNQIGINGLILTRDGYVLIEKRDHHKTTWKNKFAQSISLALKADELKMNTDGVLGDTYEDANMNLKHVIEKTIKSNFGLKPSEYEEFSLDKNFLGLARDLLEGGKPNLYFYVTTHDTAKDLLDKLRDYAKNADTDTALSSGKLTSDYYLVPFDAIKIDYTYSLHMDKKKAIRVPRRLYPRLSRRVEIKDTLKYKAAKLVQPTLKRECGEALLATISYLELCRDRIDAIKERGK